MIGEAKFARTQAFVEFYLEDAGGGSLATLGVLVDKAALQWFLADYHFSLWLKVNPFCICRAILLQLIVKGTWNGLTTADFRNSTSAIKTLIQDTRNILL